MTDPDPMRFFPEVVGLEKTLNQWIIEPIPTPRFEVACPVCSLSSAGKHILIRQWRYHRRATKYASQHNTYRCDVSFKCTGCSFVWVHGLVVPHDHYERMTKEGPTWHFRKGRELLLAKRD